MAGIIEYVYTRMRSYLNYVLYATILLLFVMVGYYAYTKFYKPLQRAKESKDIANNGDRASIADIYFFHADWCPHCKTATPEWEAFKRDHNQQTINGSTINCIDVNCTDDNGPAPVVKDSSGKELRGDTPQTLKDLLKNFGVDSYPTIKLTKDGNTFDFDAKVTEANLTEFVNSVL